MTSVPPSWLKLDGDHARERDQPERLFGAHLVDAGGVLAQVVLRHVRTSEILVEHFDQPAVVLAAYVNKVLESEMLLKDLVRDADAEWGRTLGERPHFEQEGRSPHPDDPYTFASVRDALTRLARKATRGDE